MKRKFIVQLFAGHIKKTWYIWIVSITFPAVFTDISRLLIAQLTQDSMYRTTAEDKFTSTVLIVFLLLAGAAAAEIMAGAFRYLQYSYGIDTENKLRQNMYHGLLHRRIFHNNLEIGEISIRYNSDVKAAVSMICADMDRCIFPIIVGGTFCVAIFIKSYIIGIGIMAILIIVIALSMVFINQFNQVEKRILEKKDSYSEQISSAYGGKMTVRMMNLQEYVDQSNEKVVKELDLLNKRKVRLTFIKALTVDNLTALCATLVLPFACVLVGAGVLELPKALYISSLSGSIIGFTSSLSLALIDLKRDYISAGRIEQQLAYPQERYDLPECWEQDLQPDKEAGKPFVKMEIIGTREKEEAVLGFNDFGVEYDGRRVLQKVNLSIHKGEIVALVGKSGCGKSSLIKAVLGLVDYKGSVFLQHRNVQSMTIGDIRKRIAYVPEENNIFHSSVYENIHYGNLEADKTKILNAMRHAGLTEYTKEDKMIDFNTGENGDNLSGGLKQRVAIARAFLKNADILFLDEPTAALDAMTEHYIMEYFRHLADSGKSIVIISHRASTISYADRIFVVKDYEVNEEQDVSDVKELLRED